MVIWILSTEILMTANCLVLQLKCFLVGLFWKSHILLIYSPITFNNLQWGSNTDPRNKCWERIYRKKFIFSKLSVIVLFAKRNQTEVEMCFHFQNVKGFIVFIFFLFPGSWKLEKMEGSDFCDLSHENWRKLKCLIFAKFHENSRKMKVFLKIHQLGTFCWHMVIYKFPVARGHLQIPCGTRSFRTQLLWCFLLQPKGQS